MFACQECGKKFKTVAAAQRAMNDRCPRCGGYDIDLDPSARPSARPAAKPTPAGPIPGVDANSRYAGGGYGPVGGGDESR